MYEIVCGMCIFYICEFSAAQDQNRIQCMQWEHLLMYTSSYFSDFFYSSDVRFITLREHIHFTNLVLFGYDFSHKHVLYIPLIFRLITIWQPSPLRTQTYCGGKRLGWRVSFWDLMVVSFSRITIAHTPLFHTSLSNSTIYFFSFSCKRHKLY